MKKDLWKIYFLGFITNLMFFMPMIYIYYLDIGFSFSQIFMLESAFSVGYLIFLLPFGALADYIGRKKVLIINAAIGIICNLVYYFSENFIVYLFTQIVWSVVFINSISRAFMFDFLDANNKSKEYKKYQGMFFFFALLGSAVASIVGGIVSQVSMKLPFLLSSISHIVAIILLFQIEHKEKKSVHKNYFSILKGSLNQIKKSSWTKWLFVYYATTGIAFRLFFPLVQPYMQKTGLGLVSIGFATAAFFMVGSITGKYVKDIENKLKDWTYLISFLCYIIPIFFLALFTPVWGFIIIGLIFFGGVIVQIMFEHEVLSSTVKKYHATIISFAELGFRGGIAFIAPLFGWYLTKVGDSKALLTLGTIMILIIPIYVWFFIRVRKK
jgi:MFS family permease